MADVRAQVNRARDAANDAATTATGRIRETTAKAREGAGELVQTGRDKAGMAYGDARDKTQRVATRANQIVQDHPVAAVAGAIAVGAVVAWMFPKSRAMMKALPGLAVTAGSRVAEAAVAARVAAAEGAETVKTNAAHALHNAGDAASHALHSATDAAAHARDNLASADLSAKASKLADDVTSLVAHRIEALGDAVKARLPKS
ncbi:hypothetical protein [Sphingobium sp. Ant17]|uniref:hypothetical protein n=1 Tax=Sphingobium sp. Ant17 TaxID=1461752 RepID=UPI00044F140E|nr:hypothetical protein [Sphingobium sp. Ant17]EXS71835.1 hypothetical protein BF95_15220 [Sphingobium sp. Ant17]